MSVFDQLESEQTFRNHLRDSALAAVYFSGPDCGVCQVLKPRLADLFREHFPALAVAEVDCSRLNALAASQSVFAIPTLLIYIDGRESSRFARSFSPAQVRDSLQRPYSLFVDD
jgi:thioredoxin 1